GPGDTAPPAHAAWLISLAIATIAGAALSATGFCAVSAARQVFQRPKVMLVAAVLLICGYGVVAALTGNWRGGFDGQPIAHTDSLWNFLAMVLVGLAGVLAGGCPVRQMVMTGEGNGDAFMTVSGLVVGGALAHNWGIASSGAGVTTAGMWAVVIGLAVSVVYAAATTSALRRAA
ncbi:MAG: YedE family putative selenium transporter, partial [Planctomycetota bacterium]